MPELPDVTVYAEHLARRLTGATLLETRIVSLNLLRTVEPPIDAAEGRRVTGVERLGKRIAVALEDDLWLVFHLMIAGRFRWREGEAKPPARVGLAAFTFSTGTLILTEAGTKQRASLHLIRGRAALAALDPGGIEVFEATLASFRTTLVRQDHTLKRALTDPHLLSGIGNAYSDEILHAARLSPLKRTSQLTPDEWRRLFAATRRTLALWTERLREQTGDAFPEKVTAFHAEMAVHGKFRQPCPVCGAPVQRIVYAENETNYCAKCQTGGRLLADRALSRLLKKDWPRTLEEMEGG